MPDPATPPTHVDVVTPSGRTVTVDAATADSIIRQGGRPSSGVEGDAAAQASAEAARYDSFGAGAAFGVLRSLSGGLSDVAFDAIGAGHDVAKFKEHNTAGSLVGEIGTALLPVGAPGLISKAARAAGDAVRGTTAAGKIAAGVVEATVDGGAWNAAQQVSTSALTGDPLTVEKLALSIGTGALFSGAVGGGLSAVGATSGAIRKRMAGDANPLLNVRSQGAKDLGQHFGHSIKEAEEGVDDVINRARDKRAGEILQQRDAEVGGFATNPDDYNWAKGTGPAPRSTPSPIANDSTVVLGKGKGAAVPVMVTQDMQSRLRGLGFTDDTIKGMTPQQAWDKLNDTGTAVGKGKGKMPAADGTVPGKRSPKSFDTPTEVDTTPNQLVPGPDQVTQGGKRSVKDTAVDALPAGRAEGALAKDAAQEAKLAARGAQDELRAFEKADTMPAEGPQTHWPTAKPGESAVAYAIRMADGEFAEVRNGLKAARKNAVKVFGEDLTVDLAALARKPVAHAFKDIQAIDDYLGLVQRAKELGGDQFVDVQKLVVGRIQQKATGPVADAFNGLANMDRAGLADVLKLNVDKVPQFGPVGEHLAKAYGVARYADNVSAQAAVSAAEAKLAAVETKSAGGLFGGKLQMAAQAASLLSLARPGHVLMKLATLAGKVSGDIAEGVDKFVQAAAGSAARKSYVRAGSAIFNQVKFSDREDTSDGASPAVRRIRELQELQGNPGRLDTFVDDQLAPLRAHNQDLGYQVADQLKMRIGFIASKAPKIGPPDPFTGWQEEPSKAELSEWGRYIEAAEKGPAALLEELNSGDLAPETVETVKELYPGLFEKIQEMVIERVIDSKKPVRYEDRVNLSQLFDVPVEPTQAPETVFAIQEMYALQAEQQEAAKPRGTPKPPSMTKGQQFSA